MHKCAEQRVEHGAIPDLGSSYVLEHPLQQVFGEPVLLHHNFSNTSDS